MFLDLAIQMQQIFADDRRRVLRHHFLKRSLVIRQMETDILRGRSFGLNQTLNAVKEILWG